jgi:tRNA pseudouridine55 synthase
MNVEGGTVLCGVLSLNKPTGVTSRWVVDRAVKAFGRKVKVGHAGTLDPLASGVLVVCVGAATRLIAYVQQQSKTYRTVVRLGARSDTLDADGAVEEVAGAVAPGLEAVRAAVATQVGTILQKPPEYSALKVDGRRAYDLARAGEAVDLASRPVVVYRVEILSYVWPRLELEVDCGSGTYIRSIARDIGDALGCGGLVEVLIRTRIGRFALEDAIDPAVLSSVTAPGLVRPARAAVAQLPEVILTAHQVSDVALGRSVAVENPPAGEVAMLGPDGLLVAVGESDPAAGRVAPRRVLVGAG